MNPATPATDVNPIGLALTLVMGLLLVVLPRRYAFAPVVILCCYMTMGQAIVVAGCHFTMIRVLILFGWVRLLVRGELRSFKWNDLDKMIVAWAICSFVIYITLWQNLDAITYKLGTTYNVIGFYFLFRMLLLDVEDCIRVFKVLAIGVMPLAGLMLLEKSTGRNLFAMFGGVSAITPIRDGVLRCMGPFAHPILAGTFGANLVAFFLSLWGKPFVQKLLCITAIASALAIAVSSGSSGPVLTVLIATAAMCMWPFRKRLRIFRWGLVVTLIVLQIFMKAPVWFVLARVDVFSGSTGFHRALLIDRAINNLGDWFLLGTKSTAAWDGADQHLFDVTNQYIAIGAEGGLLAMMLFIWIIVIGFRYVGRSLAEAEKKADSTTVCVALWAMGAALMGHTVTYLSVSYFDQNFVTWYLLLAMIATAGEVYLRPLVAPSSQLVPTQFVDDRWDIPRGSFPVR